MTPQEIVELRAPTYAGEARLPDLITLATEQTGTVFGTNRNMAIALLVLHWLALESRGTASSPGAITSESEGDLSRSYGNGGSWSNDYLGQTSFGLELIAIRRANIFAARNRMVTT